MLPLATTAGPTPFLGETPIMIRSVADIVIARHSGRTNALALGFGGADVTLITAAISEVARNILQHAEHGVITLSAFGQNDRRGMRIVARDEGPGIADVDQAMKYDYSVGRGIGMGLPGAKWLVDEFNLASTVGRGTTVTMVKWLPSADVVPPAL